MTGRHIRRCPACGRVLPDHTANCPIERLRWIHEMYATVYEMPAPTGLVDL